MVPNRPHSPLPPDDPHRERRSIGSTVRSLTTGAAAAGPAVGWHNGRMAHDLIGLRALAGIGESDCETIGVGVLAQPVNAITSATYIAIGLWLVAGALRRGTSERATGVAFGLVVTSIGIGSVAFHGPQPPGSRLVHDLSLAAVFTLIAARGLARILGWSEKAALGTFVATTVLVGAVLAAAPGGWLVLIVVSGAAALGVEIFRYRTDGRNAPAGGVAWGLGAIAALLVIGGAVNLLGRSGAALCDPQSMYQGHALWHVLTAAALGIYGSHAFAGEGQEVQLGSQRGADPSVPP